MFWEVAIETWTNQIAVNENVHDLIDGLAAVDGAILRTMNRIDWTVIGLGVVVGALSLDRLWQIFRRRIIDSKWHNSRRWRWPTKS